MFKYNTKKKYLTADSKGEFTGHVISLLDV